jgi:hypothetical protein
MDPRVTIEVRTPDSVPTSGHLINHFVDDEIEVRNGMRFMPPVEVKHYSALPLIQKNKNIKPDYKSKVISIIFHMAHLSC